MLNTVTHAKRKTFRLADFFSILLGAASCFQASEKTSGDRRIRQAAPASFRFAGLFATHLLDVPVPPKRMILIGLLALIEGAHVLSPENDWQQDDDVGSGEKPGDDLTHVRHT